MGAPFAFGKSALVDSNGVPTRTGLLFFASLPGSSSPVSITVTGGTVTLDLSQGNRFILLMTADATLSLPTNAPSSTTVAPVDWTLIVQQDGVGGHSLLTPDYHMNYALSTAQSPLNTESVQKFSTDSSSTRVTAAPSIDQPIP